MNKEDILLNSYSILIKDPKKNADHIRSIISQFCVINPKMAIRCWLDILNDNRQEIEKSEIKDNEYKYGSYGYALINSYESELEGESFFADALGEFCKNKQLLELVYTKYPLKDYLGARYAISYLIKNNRLQEANAILAAIYKNRTFKAYGSLWESIIHRFQYYELDNYSDSGWTKSDIKKGPEIQEFCMSWAERILDKEEKAIAVTHIMRIF